MMKLFVRILAWVSLTFYGVLGYFVWTTVVLSSCSSGQDDRIIGRWKDIQSDVEFELRSEGVFIFQATRDGVPLAINGLYRLLDSGAIMFVLGEGPDNLIGRLSGPYIEFSYEDGSVEKFIRVGEVTGRAGAWREVTPLLPVQGAGCSMITPDEAGWQLTEQQPGKLGLFKLGESTDESYVFDISFSWIPEFSTDEEFFAHAMEIREKNRVSGARFQHRDHREEIDGTRFRFYSIYDDYSARGVSADSLRMVCEEAGFYARHPLSPHAMVVVVYSHRYFPGHADPGFMRKADWMMKNTNFIQ